MPGTAVKTVLGKADTRDAVLYFLTTILMHHYPGGQLLFVLIVNVYKRCLFKVELEQSGCEIL